MKRLVDQESQLEVDSLSDRQPMELPQHSTSAGDESCCRVLDRLEAPEQTDCDDAEQGLWNFRSLELSFPGAKVLGTFAPTTFVHGYVRIRGRVPVPVVMFVLQTPYRPIRRRPHSHI